MSCFPSHINDWKWIKCKTDLFLPKKFGNNWFSPPYSLIFYLTEVVQGKIYDAVHGAEVVDSCVIAPSPHQYSLNYI